jgi:hypothetical protein
MALKQDIDAVVHDPYLLANYLLNEVKALRQEINPVSNLAVLGEIDDLVGVDGTGDNAAPLVETEARLDAIEAKVDAIIAKLIASGLMSA